MSNYNMILENQVEMVELSDEAMEAVSGGGTTITMTVESERELGRMVEDMESSSLLERLFETSSGEDE